MLESPVYQEILEEGIAKGQEEGIRESVLDVLDVRFGGIPPDIEAAVRSIRGKKQLESLLRKVVVVESVEAFREHLAKVQET